MKLLRAVTGIQNLLHSVVLLIIFIRSFGNWLSSEIIYWIECVRIVRIRAEDESQPCVWRICAPMVEPDGCAVSGRNVLSPDAARERKSFLHGVPPIVGVIEHDRTIPDVLDMDRERHHRLRWTVAYKLFVCCMFDSCNCKISQRTGWRLGFFFGVTLQLCVAAGCEEEG